nr:reverse transcriptase domain-containing protein [Tanacetum cinerariifolium]
EFPGMDECLALADLGASINLIPFSVWEALLLLELTPTYMTLELADRSVSKPIGIVKDVSFKVGVFQFPADFVDVDFEPDPPSPLNSREVFLKDRPTHDDDQFVSTTSHTFTPFGDSDFLLFKEADAFLGLEDDPDSPKINPFYYDSEGDILLLEAILNSEPLPHLPNHEQYLPSYKKELKVCEAKTVKSSVDEPPEVKLKDLPPHLEYVLDTKGAENLAADHLSRLENPYENMLDPKEVNETFPLETLSMVTFCGDSSAPWKLSTFSRLATMDPRGDIMVQISLPKKSLISVSSGPPSTKMPTSLLKIVTRANDKEKFHNVEAKALPTNDARVVCKFLKSLFARFGSPRAIINDRGNHFCNDQFTKVMLKYEVTHRLSTAYHPQTSGQVEVSNRGLKRILERIIGENCASWLDKLDDALWAFRTSYKTPIRCTPYKLVYGKVCHLLIELEHKAYWALKQANFDLTVAGDHRKVQLNELNELRDHAYENSLIYKEKTKRIHDSKIKKPRF